MLALNIFYTVAAAAALYWLGAMLVRRVTIFSRYCIPAPLVGGLMFALVNTFLYVSGGTYIQFDSHIQSFLMIVFFTTVGFTARLDLLKQGGKVLMIALVLATILTLMQNFLGAGVLYAMGEDPRLGLAVGSISLIGGPGTAAAFGPVLESAGAAGGSVVGISAATFGLIMGSICGGPMADWLIRRSRIAGRDGPVVIHEEEQTRIRTSWERIASLVGLILFCIGVGAVLCQISRELGLTLPLFVGAMTVAVLVRNFNEMDVDEFPDAEADIVGNVSLCGFLTMAMMSLRIWELADLAGPLVVALSLQTIMLLAFSGFIVFPMLGRDYDAAVMTAGFIGFSMGATSNAMANMQAVSRKYGPSPTAFIVIPIVGGMLIDIINSVAVSLMIPMLGSFA